MISRVKLLCELVEGSFSQLRESSELTLILLHTTYQHCVTKVELFKNSNTHTKTHLCFVQIFL